MGILDTTSEATKQTDIDEILGFLASLEKVLPTEKDMKENLIENRVYNEYNVEELQASFGYVSDLLCQVYLVEMFTYIFAFRSIGRVFWEGCFQTRCPLTKSYLCMTPSTCEDWAEQSHSLTRGESLLGQPTPAFY